MKNKLLLIIIMLFSMNFYGQNFKDKSNFKIDINAGILTEDFIEIDEKQYPIYQIDSIDYIKCEDLNHVEYPFWIGVKTNYEFKGKNIYTVYTDFQNETYCIFKLSDLNNQPYVVCLNKISENDFLYDVESGSMTGKVIYIEGKMFSLYSMIDNVYYVKCKDKDGIKYAFWIGYPTEYVYLEKDVYTDKTGTDFCIFTINELGYPIVEHWIEKK